MISKEMYRLLKNIPRWPQNKTYKELKDLNFLDDLRVGDLLDEATNRGYIVRISRSAVDISNFRFYLAEEGQEAIEDYQRQRHSSAKATWAIILSAMSLVVSIIAIIQSVGGVQ